jgi:pimeloyl-ACP methyl ester carboxylesterase
MSETAPARTLVLLLVLVTVFSLPSGGRAAWASSSAGPQAKPYSSASALLPDASTGCSAQLPGKAEATFRWTPIAGSAVQWLDLSLFDNGFAPGTFISAGPLSGSEDTFTWEGLLPDSVHYWRVNSLVGGAWQPSETAVLLTPRCVPGAAVLLEVRQECSTAVPGTVRVEFRWQPSTLISAQQQWLDLSLFDNGFLPGTFIGAGPLPVSTGSFSWDGIKPGLLHHWRVNTMLGPAVWVSSETGSFVSLAGCPVIILPPAPTPTPAATATPAPTPTSARTVVVFLRGLGSSLVGGIETPTDSFATIKGALQAIGYNWALDFVDFSYAGPVGHVGPLLFGPDYGCPQTGQDINNSVSTLYESLSSIAQAYNGNVRFALVGHSLGGLVAVLGMSYPLVETVVTLDSPLMGVGSEKAFVGPLIGCDGPVWDQMAWMHSDADWPPNMQERTRQFRLGGARIATLGNENDCYYDPPQCPDLCARVLFVGCLFTTDDTMTQIIPNANVHQLYRLGSDESWGHRDILSDPTAAAFIASFIGPP